ncbi:hypothetical protein QBC37DRAFT_286509 [Rhypophila decipiens]|uniref:Peptidase C14 caspase domain-containing protein n=1 Tax=Rhypophila decipiens TaxID=261697 RepID=A0AAN6YBW1_9PEZI|nr:hypothetical protein QBC37DRAFT_286509 [Rhypophila decipiens]
MTTDSRHPNTYWSVIIGSGVASQRSPAADGSWTTVDRSLDGAVEDVIAIESLLANLSKTVKLDIKSLKGSRATSRSIAGAPIHPRPAEEAAIWPTFNNVCEALIRIIQRGNPGDGVYIHFSGHGTRRHDDGAVALALYDQACGTSYLSGTILRKAIHSMVEKGLLVTLVLDCCFSGSVLRGAHGLENAKTRFIEYDPECDIHQDDRLFHSLGSSSRPGELRDAALILDRLLDPRGYTIFTACGPHETAYDIRFQDGICRGAFSYFWTKSLATFRQRRARCTHQSLHQHIHACFRSYFHQQTPMLFGNKNHHLFEPTAAVNEVGAVASLISVYREKQSGRLILEAGQAHGVHHGDEYALSPYQAEPGLTAPATTAKVIAAHSLTSELELTSRGAGTQTIVITPGTPWEADLLTSLSPQKIPIHAAPNIMNFLAIDSPPLYLDLSSTEPPLFLLTAAPGTSTAFTITPTNTTSLSTAAATSISTTATTLIPTLDHLTRFKFFERLDNRTPSPAFEYSFSLDVADLTPGPDGVYEVSHGSDFVLHMTNRSVDGSPLYVALFMLSPAWEVRNLVDDAEGGDSTIVVEACGTKGMELPLEMTVPSPRGGGLKVNVTEDVIKVFVLARPAGFPAVVLGPLVIDGDRGDDRGGQQDDGLERVLGVLEGQHGERGDDRGKGWWCCRSFSVRTLRGGGESASVG